MDALPKARSPLTAVCCKPYIPHPGGNSKRPQDLTTGRASLSRRRPQGANSSRLWHVESSPFWLLPLTTIRVYRSWKTIAQPTRFSNESIFPDSLLGGFFLPLGFFNTGRPCSSPPTRSPELLWVCSSHTQKRSVQENNFPTHFLAILPVPLDEVVLLFPAGPLASCSSPFFVC